MPPLPRPEASPAAFASTAAAARRYWLPILLLSLGLFFQAFVLPSSYPRSHYDVLGLQRGAPVESVEAAYRRLSEHWRGNLDDQLTDEIFKIRYAYELLKNPIWKRDYDLFGIDEHLEKFEVQKGEHQLTPKPALPLITEPPINITDYAFNILTQETFSSAIGKDKPLLIQVFSSGSTRCNDFVEKWKRINSLFDGVADTAVIELGDVRLAGYFAEKKFAKLPFFRDGLPAIVAYPASCKVADCFMRYHGELSTDAIVDWMATTVMGLPRILYYSKETLVPNFIAQSDRNKVRVILFSNSGERAAPYLRQAAQQYSGYASFAFVLWKEDDSQYWINGLGVESAPAVVFFKGPGVKPTVHHGNLESSQFVELMEEHKHLGLPQLKSETAQQLGCDARWHSRAGNDTPVWYCVIVAGRSGPQLGKMRETVSRAEGKLLRDIESMRSRTEVESLDDLSSSASALKDSRLTFAWLDGEVQKKMCAFYLGSDYAGTCGDRSHDPDDVARLFIIRFQRSSTDDATRAERRSTTFMDAIRGSDAQYASQLVARYSGSENIDEIIQWISKIISDGDSRHIPHFTQKVPDFVPDRAPSRLSIGANVIRQLGRSFNQFVQKVALLLGDVLTDPRLGPGLLMSACLTFGAIWFKSSQSSSPQQKEDAAYTGKRQRSVPPWRRQQSASGAAERVESITDFEPKDAYQFLSGSDSD